MQQNQTNSMENALYELSSKSFNLGESIDTILDGLKDNQSHFEAIKNENNKFESKLNKFQETISNIKNKMHGV